METVYVVFICNPFYEDVFKKLIGVVTAKQGREGFLLREKQIQEIVNEYMQTPVKIYPGDQIYGKFYWPTVGSPSYQFDLFVEEVPIGQALSQFKEEL